MIPYILAFISIRYLNLGQMGFVSSSEYIQKIWLNIICFFRYRLFCITLWFVPEGK